MTNEEVVVGKTYHYSNQCVVHGLEEFDVTISGPPLGKYFPATSEVRGPGFVTAENLTPLSVEEAIEEGIGKGC